MERDFAIELLKEEFANNKPGTDGKYIISTAPIWKVRSKANPSAVHNVWLIPVVDDGGSRIFNATAAVAAATGLKMDPNTGGIPCSISWVRQQQLQALERALGLKLRAEGV